MRQLVERVQIVIICEDIPLLLYCFSVNSQAKRGYDMKAIIFPLSIFFILLSAGYDARAQKDPVTETGIQKHLITELSVLKGPHSKPGVQKGGGNDTDDDSIAPDEGGPPSFEESEPLPERDCSSDEIDPETGERISVPNVDIVVSYLEIFTTDLGTWIRPTVKNQCGDPAIGELNIFIRSDSDRDVGLITSASVNIPAHTEVAWSYALGVPHGTSYTVVANWGNTLAEANHANNTCARSSTGRCP